MKLISRKNFLIISGAVVFVLRLFFFGLVVKSIISKELLNFLITILSLFFSFLPDFIKGKKIVMFHELVKITFLGFVFLSIYLGGFQDLFSKIWWWDIMLHTFSGFLLAFLGFVIIFSFCSSRKIPFSLVMCVIFSFSFSFSLGATWEIFEFGADHFFKVNLQRNIETGVFDTMYDLISDFSGAAFLSILIYVFKKSQKPFLLKQMVKVFIKQ